MEIQTFAPVYDVDACLDQIRDCLERGWTGQGFKTLEFEEAWKRYTGLNNAHFLCSATAGLNLAVEIMKEVNGWSDGDEVISTPLTFIATNNAVVKSQMKVVFADVDESFCLDPEDIKRKIAGRTRAVLFVGLGGNTGKYDEVVKICRKHGLKLILDAAHMAGTKLNGKTPGIEADAVVYSFHVTKNLSTADGGMLCFRDNSLDDMVRKRSWNGIDKTSSPERFGKNYKWKYNIQYVADAYNGNSIMAAIALAQLPHLDKENEVRREMAARYTEGLSGLGDKVGFAFVPEGCVPAQWLYQILVEDRDELMEFLNDHGVHCALHYLDNTEYPMYSYAFATCKRAHEISEHSLTLPLHLKMTGEDVDCIVGLIREFIERKGIRYDSHL